MTLTKMRRVLCFAVALGLAVVASSGCRYVRNALLNAPGDLMDIGRADLSLSLGTDMGAHIMLTKYVQLKSYAYDDLLRVGSSPRMLGIWREDRDDWWLGPWQSSQMKVQSRKVGALSLWQAQRMRSEYAKQGMVAETPDEIGVGFHVFVIGFRVGFRPLELADLFTSPFGLDLAHDDITVSERRKMREARKAAREAEKAREGESQPQDNKAPPQAPATDQ